MDAGRTELVTSQIDLADLVAEVISDSGTEVGYRGPGELLVVTDPARVRVVLRNLVANAAQHGAPPVTITVIPQPGELLIDVHDCGSGVPEALRERVFDRFVRGDESRHGSSAGLGLAIAAENARLLHGSLTLQPDAARFRFRLPLRGTGGTQA